MESRVVLSILTVLLSFHDFRVDSGILSPYDETTEGSSIIIGGILPTCILGVDTILMVVYNESDFDHPITVDLNSTQIPVNATRSTVFIAHGFTSNANTTLGRDLARVWAKLYGANVFSVDWKQGACDDGIDLAQLASYPSAVGNARTVGKYIARFIGRLVNEYGVSLEDVTLVGHSLGAHVVGFAGQALQKYRIGKASRLIALDPAGPLFELSDANNRVSKEDAVFTQAFHTSSVLGMSRTTAHDDFYFNGGHQQPGCSIVELMCNHGRAVEYLIEIIEDLSCLFVGIPWNRLSMFPPKSNCTRDTCTIAGPYAESYPARGSFYVRTGDEKPWCTKAPISLSSS